MDRRHVVGEFSYEDSTGTFVGFRVEEELSGIGSTTAVGRTPTVSGTITFDGTTLTAATIEADMTAITTNDSRRDDNVQDALETDQFPTATFVLTEPIELGDAANTGAATTVEATGDLTIHGVTTTVTLPLEAQLVDGTIVVVGSLDIDLSTTESRRRRHRSSCPPPTRPRSSCSCSSASPEAAAKPRQPRFPQAL